MDDCENSDEKLLEKEDFYSHMEDIARVHYTHTKEFVKILK